MTSEEVSSSSNSWESKQINHDANGVAMPPTRPTQPSDVIVLDDDEGDVDEEKADRKRRKLVHSFDYREKLEIAMLSKIEKELEHITVEVEALKKSSLIDLEKKEKMTAIDLSLTIASARKKLKEEGCSEYEIDSLIAFPASTEEIDQSARDYFQDVEFYEWDDFKQRLSIDFPSLLYNSLEFQRVFNPFGERVTLKSLQRVLKHNTLERALRPFRLVIGDRVRVNLELETRLGAPCSTNLFCTAIEQKFWDIVDAMINSRIETTESLEQKLVASAKVGSMFLCEKFLDEGAKPRGIPKSVDPASIPPLFYAVSQNNTELVELLFNRGAKVRKSADQEETLLHLAARSGNVKIAQYLLEHGADIDAMEPNCEWTPIHEAAAGGKNDMCRFLVDRGCNLDLMTLNDQRAFELARKGGHTFVATFLENEWKARNYSTEPVDEVVPEQQQVADVSAEPETPAQHSAAPVVVQAEQERQDHVHTSLAVEERQQDQAPMTEDTPKRSIVPNTEFLGRVISSNASFNASITEIPPAAEQRTPSTPVASGKIHPSRLLLLTDASPTAPSNTSEEMHVDQEEEVTKEEAIARLSQLRDEYVQPEDSVIAAPFVGEEKGEMGDEVEEGQVDEDMMGSETGEGNSLPPESVDLSVRVVLQPSQDLTVPVGYQPSEDRVDEDVQMNVEQVENFPESEQLDGGEGWVDDDSVLSQQQSVPVNTPTKFGLEEEATEDAVESASLAIVQSLEEKVVEAVAISEVQGEIVEESLTTSNDISSLPEPSLYTTEEVDKLMTMEAQASVAEDVEVADSQQLLPVQTDRSAEDVEIADSQNGEPLSTGQDFELSLEAAAVSEALVVLDAALEDDARSTVFEGEEERRDIAFEPVSQAVASSEMEVVDSTEGVAEASAVEVVAAKAVDEDDDSDDSVSVYSSVYDECYELASSLP